MEPTSPFSRCSIVLTAFAALILTAACGPKAEEDTGPVVRPAKLFTVEAPSTELNLNFPAVLEASSTAVLTFPVPGTLEQILVKAGDEVAEGTVIARLDPRIFENAVSSAQTQYDEAQEEFGRAERLLAQDAIAQSVYNQRKTRVEVAGTVLDDAKKALEDSVLIAPFDGLVSQRHLDQAQNVAAGQSIVTLQSTQGIEAVVNAPATLVANIDFVEPITTTVRIDVRPDLVLPAVMGEYATQADPATQTFEARFQFEVPDGVNILPGMTGTLEARFSIIAEDFLQMVAIPIGSVISDGEDKYVWLVDPETNLVSRQVVETGERVGETVVIESGLEAGSVVVAAGAAYLVEGMQVRPYNP